MLPGDDVCRICGFRPAFPPYGEDGCSASYEICASCGNEYGVTDRHDRQIEQRREDWLRTGPGWYSQHTAPPADWDPWDQLQQVPDHFRYPDEECWDEEMEES